MEKISKQKKKRPGMVQGPGWSAQRPGGDMKKAGKKAIAKKPGASTRPRPGGPVKPKPIKRGR